jgi:two-component system, OmpR family, sensor histidine kinase KdpD
MRSPGASMTRLGRGTLRARRPTPTRIALAMGAFAASTILIAILDATLGVQPASIYLLAVVVAAIAAGTWAAVGTSLASFILFDFLFVEPRYTLTIRDPEEWLNLVVFLFVALVAGRLTALQVERADEATARAREAATMFQISRLLGSATRVADAAVEVLGPLLEPAGIDRAWVGVGSVVDREQVIADTDPAAPRRVPPSLVMLRRTPGERPAEWIRVHEPRPGRERAGEDVTVLRVPIDADGRPYGSLWAVRARKAGLPDIAQRRLLAAAADQLGQSLRRDRLVQEATEAEIARQSDELKSALLQSVSHDLRTPLATIRAAAGTLRPDSRLSDEDRLESAEAIDREVEYLDRLVTNLLDLSRIEAGALRADRELFELDDLIDRSIERFGRRLDAHRLVVDVPSDWVDVDPVLLDNAVSNILENALKYVPAGAEIRVGGGRLPDEPFVRLTIEDGGSGVPAAALPRLFEKFYRAPGARGGSRSGTGIGLAVVRGLVEATGGRVAARRSDLGGLAIDLDVPAAPPSVATHLETDA